MANKGHKECELFRKVNQIDDQMTTSDYEEHFAFTPSNRLNSAETTTQTMPQTATSPTKTVNSHNLFRDRRATADTNLRKHH